MGVIFSTSLTKTRSRGGLLLAAALAAAGGLRAGEAWDRVRSSGELRWGAEAAGGAPYVFRDPDHPDVFRGFECDLMDALARRLGVRPRLVVIPWDELVPALLREDVDAVFNGLEITPARSQKIAFTIPYYFFSEQITVRRGDARFRRLEDLRGHRVGTLAASLAQNLLEGAGGITVVAYPSTVDAYRDLEIGRTDATLMDVPIAQWYAGPNPRLENPAGAVAGAGIYAGGVRPDSPELKERLDESLRAMIRSGELDAIYEKWNIRAPDQDRLKDALRGDASSLPSNSQTRNYAPLLFRGAAMTILLSLSSMLIAVGVGLALCLGRLYGPRWMAAVAAVIVEVTRGTPLLIQLYVLYYGLPNLGIQLNAFAAAVLGVGFNYAAYESEIYRAGLLSIPRGQDEAARSLGLTGFQSLRYVILPQAVRTILPPSTNDFIALFKDTSLVSIITVTELTRAYNQAATATFRYLELGLLTAALYLAMSLPLALWTRSLERRRHVAVH